MFSPQRRILNWQNMRCLAPVVLLKPCVGYNYLTGALGKGGPVGPGPLPRRGDLGDVQFILQEVSHPPLTPYLQAWLWCDSLPSFSNQVHDAQRITGLGSRDAVCSVP